MSSNFVFKLALYNLINCCQLMSGKLETKRLLARDMYTNEHNVFANSSLTFSAYDGQLDQNLRIILIKFPTHDRKKVRDLLEELDNRIELVIDILNEEKEKCSLILEEKKGDTKKHLNLSQDQENKILKQSFLNLYKKYLHQKQAAQELQKKNDSLGSEVQKLRELNRLLMQGEYNSSNILDSTPIY